MIDLNHMGLESLIKAIAQKYHVRVINRSLFTKKSAVSHYFEVL